MRSMSLRSMDGQSPRIPLISSHWLFYHVVFGLIVPALNGEKEEIKKKNLKAVFKKAAAVYEARLRHTGAVLVTFMRPWR